MHARSTAKVIEASTRVVFPILLLLLLLLLLLTLS
jgi:hypothetical protein